MGSIKPQQKMELSKHELRLLLSAITAKEKRLKGSIKCNIKTMTQDTAKISGERVERRREQLREYASLRDLLIGAVE